MKKNDTHCAISALTKAIKHIDKEIHLSDGDYHDVSRIAALKEVQVYLIGLRYDYIQKTIG
jgi:hypothetical protein